MFCCIHINADQQPLQCILWREEPHHELQTFKLTTLSFGLKPAPHIATRCLLHLAQETRTALQQLPDAARSSAELSVAAAAAAAIEEHFYADDLLLSGDDEHRIAQVALEVDRVLRTANFHLPPHKHMGQPYMCLQPMHKAKLYLISIELSAALLLAVNMKDMQSALKVSIDDIQYWSDSTITLAWINTEPHKLNRFVANRVTRIQALTDQSKWRWVPSNENPADLLSRGVLPDKLVNCTSTF
ncbi:unnamed protein product [Parnassius apollo]|uniref:(apollo) hypothetical protein n=1 Tax=Parnassius apollo TaxID=110799 RepID=A0A8S3W4N2_PARAO|nr:unnamed protein product [Parnassius apollo]